MKKNFKKILIFFLVLALILIILNIPTTTKQGINFKVRALKLPLYIKVIEFIDRDYQYKQLVGEITANCSTDEEKILAIFNWIRKNIHMVPKGFDIIDDHVLNIIIRRYGTGDQRTDVFTTLCAYTGIPAFWGVVRLDSGDRHILLAYVKLKQRWVVFDVCQNTFFRNDSGEIASVEDIISDISIVKRKNILIHGIKYENFFKNLKPIKKGFISKEQRQMPLYRIKYELKNIFIKNN